MIARRFGSTGAVGSSRAAETGSARPLRFRVSCRRILEIDGSESAVTAKHVSPRRRAFVLQRAIVLRATEHDGRIEWMQRNPRIELGDREVRAEARPRASPDARSINSAIVAGVDHVRVLRVERERVLIDVNSAANVPE